MSDIKQKKEEFLQSAGLKGKIGENMFNDLLDLTRQQTLDELKPKIGQLRQWLNEDRITDTDKMVSNKQIEHWLGLQALKDKNK